MKPAQACISLAAILLLPCLNRLLLWSGLPLAASLVIAVAAISQTIAYLVVLTIFARSLRQGQTPLITRLAMLTRGTLPEELLVYTRRITLIWCGFCLAQALIPLALLAVAPALVLWETPLNLPLIAFMVGGEYVYRLIRYRHIQHETPGDMVRLVKQFRGVMRSP